MFLFDFLLRILKIGNKPKGFSEKLISDSNLEKAKDEAGKSSVSENDLEKAKDEVGKSLVTENDVKVMSNYIYEYLNHKYVIKGDFKFLDALPIFQRVIEMPVTVICSYCDGEINLIAEEAKQFVNEETNEIRMVCPTCKTNLAFSVKSFIENRKSLCLELLKSLKSSDKSSLNSTDIEIKVLSEKYLHFFDDQEKLYKLFLKKGIKANYFEVVVLVNKVSTEIHSNIMEERRINPAYKAISNKFGNSLDKRGIWFNPLKTGQ